ncbi:MAG: dihydropteroate synthase [Lachnospiraceae bacterium]|nr:dihydropteroate synthase [Lachnospiraceae bacterium]
MKIGGREFQIGNKTYVMGILNATPDSFSDGGRWKEPDKALFHVEKMLKDGMDILDIGGESTRPGYTMLSEEEEIARVIPVIEAIKSRFDIPVSLDTYKSGVAKAGLEAGIDLINDIWGLKYDPKMAQVIGESGVSCCLTHNRTEPDYRNFIQEVIQDLEESLRLAEQGKIVRDRIILDPGVGFGKTHEQNLQTVRNLEAFQSLGCPLLLGTSRKSLIGLALDLPVAERLEGTLVTTVMAVIKGCSFVRVHDIKENVRAIQMTEAILYHE